jgi:hypothetical protein
LPFILFKESISIFFGFASLLLLVGGETRHRMKKLKSLFRKIEKAFSRANKPNPTEETNTSNGFPHSSQDEHDRG